MIVFSDTTPILALSSIVRLDLLPTLFNEIHVVREVCWCRSIVRYKMVRRTHPTLAIACDIVIGLCFKTTQTLKLPLRLLWSLNSDVRYLGVTIAAPLRCVHVNYWHFAHAMHGAGPPFFTKTL